MEVTLWEATAWEAAALDELREEVESPTSFVLRYTLSHPGIDTIIVGTQNPAHIRENVRTAAKGPLPVDTYEEATRRLKAAIGEAS